MLGTVYSPLIYTKLHRILPGVSAEIVVFRMNMFFELFFVTLFVKFLLKTENLK